MTRYKCRTQLREGTWEYQLARPTDPSHVDDLTPLDEAQAAIRAAFAAGFNAVVSRGDFHAKALEDTPTYSWEFPEKGTSAADLEPQAWAAYEKVKA